MDSHAGAGKGGRSSDLYHLARLYNVQTSYYGLEHSRHAASPESLLAILRALGAPLASLLDVSPALRERRLNLRRRLIEPVNVITDSSKPEVRVCLPGELGEDNVEGRLETEDGEVREWQCRGGDLPCLENMVVERERYLVKSLALPEPLPHGYHRLFLRVGKRSGDSLIISAPSRTYQPPAGEDERRWGVFLPLYALRTETDWGGGDYPALGELAEKVAGRGGSVVGTLPLLPVFLDKPLEPSPYAPVSRRLWNEFYIDVIQAPGFEDCAPARKLVESSAFQEAIARLKKESLVDYARLMALKRQILEELSRHAGEEIERFGRKYPVAGEYARFRAALETRQVAWSEWPQRLRDGLLQPGDYDENIRRYYLYAQWLAARQVSSLAAKCQEKGNKLYFDLPLGVHPHGFDVWQYQDAFALEASGGAPPDAVFTTGQDWGFPPLHPEKIRRQGYRYVIEYLHHHIQYADMLRIDHIMGLHRLFWVPHGLNVSQGVYVRYPAEELYAILALESHRHRCVIIGEDLGTVPPYVRPTMNRHGIRRMYILQYAFFEKTMTNPSRIPRSALAALNTHDMPPFAAFWQDNDFAERLRLGLSDKPGVAKEKKARRLVKVFLEKYLRRRRYLTAASSGTRDIFRACLGYLSTSLAGVVLVNLEDLWLETEPQNIPSIGDDYPNWRRRARYRLEEIFRMKEITDILENVDQLRKQGRRPSEKYPQNQQRQG